MQFPVPQFIDIEDKLIGPLTLKQFGFILPGALLILLLFKIFKLGIIFYILSVPILLITLGIAFGQFNGKPLYNQFGTFIKFLTAPKKYTFSKESGSLDDLNISAINVSAPVEINTVPVLPVESDQSKLRRLSLMLDQKNEEEQDIVNPQR